nr:phosphoribosyltransferase domain-containing protein [Desulfobacter latus]
MKRENNPLREDAFTVSCLGKLFPASFSELIRFRHGLSTLLDDIASAPLSLSFQPSLPKSGCVYDKMAPFEKEKILIVGLTESGIIPAFLMYLESRKRDLKSHLIYSSRRPIAGMAFNEIHSHGPNHVLPLAGSGAVFKEIWIVEDEITSGNTVMNLMGRLRRHMHMERVRIFAFADFRTQDQKAALIFETAKQQIRCSVHIPDFFNGHGRVPGTTEHENPGTCKEGAFQIFQERFVPKVSPPFRDDADWHGWHLPFSRPALGVMSGHFFDPVFRALPSDISGGTILTVGEAVDLAACLAWSNRKIAFQQISLSPWQVDQQTIFSRMTFADRYYLYNYDRLDGPVFILSDPVDRSIEIEVIEKLREHGICVTPLTFVAEKEETKRIACIDGQ